MIGTEVLAYSHPCDMESRLRLLTKQKQRRRKEKSYSVYHPTKIRQNRFVHIQIHANISWGFFYFFSDAVSKAPVIFFDLLNFTQNQCQDVQLELL